MSSVGYRHSRGQAGQGSLPRPAWGSSSHGSNRAASPEPVGTFVSSGGGCGSSSGPSGTGTSPPLGAASDSAASNGRDRFGNPDEVILQLEAELRELRNALALKDQRIAELSRHDAKEGRLKRDIRLLAGELRNTKRQLAERSRRWQEERTQLHDALAQLRAIAPGDVTPGNSASIGVLPSGTGAAASGNDGGHLLQRSRPAETPQSHTPTGAGGLSDVRGSRAAPTYLNGTATPGGTVEGRPRTPTAATQASPQVSVGVTAAGATVAVATTPAVDEVRPCVYSTFHTEHAATVGRQELTGIGTVEGVASVAKVLLQRVNGSVYDRQAMQGLVQQQQRFAGGVVMQGMAPQQQLAAGLGGVMMPGMAVPHQQQQQLAAVGMLHNM